jgi:hypothetical protein
VHVLLGWSSFALSFASSVLLLILLIAVAIALSIFVYRHTVPDITRGRRTMLVALRAAALAVLLFLVFEPVLNLHRTETLEPRVAMLLDNSRSMTVADGGADRASLVRAIAGSSDISALASRGALSPYLFAARTSPLQKLAADSLTFIGGETNISDALVRAQEDGRDHNLRAVLLVTDGVFTSGKNPLYAAEALGVPVHVIAVGDSAEKKDLLISRVLVNNLAYVESSVPVDVSVRSAGFGESTVQVSLFEGATLVEKQSIALRAGSAEYPVQLHYLPKSDGVKKLSVRVSELPGELTVKNNRRDVFVKVLKSKMNIAVVAGAPSPDLSFVDHVFSRDKNVTVTSFVQKQGASWYAAAPTQKALLDADCIVLVGYPIAHSGTDVLQMVRTALEKEAKPLLIVFSREIDLGKLKSVLDPWLPFDVVQSRKEETQVFFELARDAQSNPVVSTGIPADAWAKLPPLFRTESSYKSRVGAQTLATMKINNIAFNEPVLLTRSLNRSKVVAFTAYGLWRWQLATDAVGGKLPDVLFSNSIRWLTTREDEKRVRIKPVKEFFDSGEPVEFTGQVYNESYEPVDDAVVSVLIKGPKGDAELLLAQQGSGRYTGAVELSGEGDYTYAGKAVRDDRELGKDEGRFSVGDLNVEYQETRMNNALLRQIAARSGGRFFTASNPAGLADAILSAPGFTAVERDIKSDIQLWNLAWLLALAVLLFAIEWYLRKQSGMI